MRIHLLLVMVAWYVPNVEPAADVLSNRPANSFKESAIIFARESFKVIAGSRTDNFVYSPLGASMVLTMAAFAAGGRTAEMLRTGLRLPVDDVRTINEIGTILERLNRDQAYEARVSSKIFTPALSQIKMKFVGMTQLFFKSRTWAVDYNDPADASLVINDWSKMQTNSWITEIVTRNDMSSHSELLLLTTGYVESKWRLPFQRELSTLRPFHVRGETVKNVTTMFVSGYFPIGELLEVDATFVELPFTNTPNGDALSMYVILPNEKGGLPFLVENFNRISMLTLMSAAPRSINVYLPKFEVETLMLLERPLMMLGFENMFLPVANFSGITEERPLRVSNVIQKTRIKVNENGGPPPVGPEINLPPWGGLEDFRVDHPFVCVIMKANEIPLFITVVNEPRSRPRAGYRRPFDGHWVWPLH